MKKCSRCQIEKELTEFSKDKRLASGIGAQCKQCVNERHGIWYEANKDLAFTLTKDWQKRNPDKVKYYSRTRDLRRYGLERSDFENMLDLQEGKCNVCLKEFLSTPCVEHCHKTKKVRGLVCKHCNTSLAWFEKNKERIMDHVI